MTKRKKSEVLWDQDGLTLENVTGWPWRIIILGEWRERQKYGDGQEQGFAAILYPKPLEDLSKKELRCQTY